MNERMRGALTGLAWGDVLGCPVEGWRKHEIEAVYGSYDSLPVDYPLERIPEKRVHRLRPLGLHSDDTQQALALLHVCLDGGWNAKNWKRLLVRGWQEQAWRGIGRNFEAAVHRLKKGVHHCEAGSPSAGMGAAMRTGPLGALFWREEQEIDLLRVSLESSLVTHRDQRAAVFAAVVAGAVAFFVRGMAREEVLAALPEWARRAEEGVSHLVENGWRVDFAGSSLVSETLQVAEAWTEEAVEKMRRNISEHARPYLNEGFTRSHPNQGFVLLGGLHGLLMALRGDLSPQETLLSIVREGFDTDTVAAIAGTVLGARHGDGWIPTERLCDAGRIRAYAEAIAGGPLPETEEELIRAEVTWTARERSWNIELRERIHME
jgi:ADP-ribosyl-[dinitrogen reductase] hydrolase